MQLKLKICKNTSAYETDIQFSILLARFAHIRRKVNKIEEKYENSFFHEWHIFRCDLPPKRNKYI